MHMQNPKRAT